jgi:hypothetical protein
VAIQYSRRVGVRGEILARARRLGGLAALAGLLGGTGCGLVLALDSLQYDAPQATDAAPSDGGPEPADAGSDVDTGDAADAAFDDETRWAAYRDPSWAGSYIAGPYDGRYVYFVRAIPDALNVPRVLRFDTDGDFTTPTSWVAFDPTSSFDLGANQAVSFDGRYLMLAGYRKHDAAPAVSGYVVRFDTTSPADFTNAAAWEVVDVRAIFPGLSVGLYTGGAAVDGSTYYPSAQGAGMFLQHQGDALDAGWSAYDPDGSIASAAAACIGPYVYFGPNNTGDFVRRYDVRSTFTDPSSWDSVDLAAFDPSLTGFYGAVSTPDNVYFTQLTPTTVDGGFDGHFRVVRHGGGDALDAGWETFPVDSVNPQASGYQSGVYDGRYVYFAPYPRAPSGGVIPGTVFLRYDTTEAFDASSAWTSFASQNVTGGTSYHSGAIFDGKYVYFAPRTSGSPIVRYRARDVKGAVPPRCSSF